MTADDLTSPAINRRAILRGLGAIGLAAGSGPALAAADAILPLPGGPRERALSSAFPGKAEMIVQRTSSPLLETPFGVFDRDVFTPNDRFYVRWHLTSLPDAIDVDSYRLAVRGHVDRPLSLSLKDIMDLPRVEIAAVNQCSGNSRGFFQPRIPGGQWGNGAMGNARWTGCSLRAVLDKAGVKSGAVGVRMRGLDRHIVEGAPNFLKTLGLDHASDGEVMIAYAMNGEPLPLLNGFPLRVVVPGWFATYWVKMLEDIEVLDAPDENFWMKTAYLIPDTPRADMAPGQQGVKFAPINRMIPRSFLTNIADGDTAQFGTPLKLRGIAFGGDCGVARVDVSLDQGATWRPADLGKDEGKYSFRRFETTVVPGAPGDVAIQVRCANDRGEAQPVAPNWNVGGFMRNVIETLRIKAT